MNLEDNNKSIILPVYRPSFIHDFLYGWSEAGHIDTILPFIYREKILTSDRLVLLSHIGLNTQVPFIFILLSIARMIDIIREKSDYKEDDKLQELIDEIYGEYKDNYKSIEQDLSSPSSLFFIGDSQHIALLFLLFGLSLPGYRNAILFGNNNEREAYLKGGVSNFLAKKIHIFQMFYSSLDNGLVPYNNLHKILNIDVSDEVLEVYNVIEERVSNKNKLVSIANVKKIIDSIDIKSVTNELVRFYLQLFHYTLLTSAQWAWTTMNFQSTWASPIKNAIPLIEVNQLNVKPIFTILWNDIAWGEDASDEETIPIIQNIGGYINPSKSNGYI